MGLFDDLRCHYPLPIEGANALDYQTKDTPAQFLDRYEIRADGTLWHYAYEIEADPDEADRLHRSRRNRSWEPVEHFTGEIVFYSDTDEGKWLEFSAYFVRGKLKCEIEVLHND